MFKREKLCMSEEMWKRVALGVRFYSNLRSFTPGFSLPFSKEGSTVAGWMWGPRKHRKKRKQYLDECSIYGPLLSLLYMLVSLEILSPVLFSLPGRAHVFSYQLKYSFFPPRFCTFNSLCSSPQVCPTGI